MNLKIIIMDKNYKPVYVQGTMTGKGVIEALEALGGINNCKYVGNCKTNIYYISPVGNFICAVNEDSSFCPYIKATAEKIKPLTWRAEQGAGYYIVDSTIEVQKMYDFRDCSDNKRYENGNYFKTKEEAEKAAEKIKKILLPD